MLLTRQSLTTPNPCSSTVIWEEVSCLLCGQDDAELLTEAADPLPADQTGLRFAIVRCRHCGLVYTNPRPDSVSIHHFYPPGYGPHLNEKKERERCPSALWSWIFGRPCRERRGKLPCSPPGRLLDFGCGGGSFLRRMQHQGWTVTGLDAVSEIIQTIRRELGCEALIGTLPHRDLRPGSFDLVTMWQALEHVHQPLCVLRETYHLLVPGGYLVVAVPNFDCFAARHFGQNWFGLDLPRHLTHFTRETLAEMLKLVGFRIISLRGLVHADWVHSSAQLAKQYGKFSIVNELLSWKVAARLGAWIGYLLGRADSLVAVAQRPE